MKALTGRYHYRSYCPKAGTPGTAQVAAPWAPPGVLAAETSAAGEVKGKLSFGPGRELAVTGSITAATAALPEGIELTGEGLGAVYRIRGYFVEGSTHLVGTVLSIQRDVAGQPDGTHGPFILFPAE